MRLVEVLTEVDEARIKRLLADDEFFWLDLVEPSDEHLDQLSALIGLHPAAIEDTREWDQLPRLDDYGDHVMLIFFSARILDGVADPVEVHVYVSGHWIVTARLCETRLESQREWLEATDYDNEDQVLYLILDALADGWDPVIDDIDRRLDVLESSVLERPQQHLLTTIYRLKQEVHELARRAGPQKANFGKSIQTIHALEGLAYGAREWLRDVDAHVTAIDSDLRRINGDLNALTDTFFNANANRLNRLATFVTVGSVFFLVWTLVTGFFGQNFGYLVRHIDSKGSFLAYELGALVVPTVLIAAIFWWRRKDWL
jgi:magnesium transporter